MVTKDNWNGGIKPSGGNITSYVSQTVKDDTGFIPGLPVDWFECGFVKYPQVKALVDENQNGIPDKWEISYGLDLKKTKETEYNLDLKYDNIEIYINSL